MKKYTAIYTDPYSEYKWLHRTMTRTDYNSKKKFIEDLRHNSFKVSAVLTDSEIQRIKTDITVKCNQTVFNFVRECM